MSRPGRRCALSSVLVTGCLIVPRLALAVLPTPGCEETKGSGSAYAGTINPTVVPRPPLPSIDMGPVTVSTTDGPGGARQVEVFGGALDVLHFGPGFSQLFTGAASLSGFVYAEIGAIHLAASGQAETLPLEYDAFPGALGENPFYAQAIVSMNGCCTDIVEVPATRDAPTMGQTTMVTLAVGFSGNETEGADDPSDLHGFSPSADLTDADGTDLGGVISGSRMLSLPVLTPIALTFCFGGQITVTAGHDLVGVLDGIIYRHGGDFASDHAFFEGLDTAEVMLVNHEGAGAMGSSGHDYGKFDGGKTVTTTTTTTTTSLFVPPPTLPSCVGYCGDGVVQSDCGEACECPMANGLSVLVCDAATALPALAPGCARCAGCAVDLSQCGASSTTTVPGATTTSTSLPATTTSTVATTSTTSTTLPCRTVRCLLDDGLHDPTCDGQTIPASITKAFDRVAQLMEQGSGGSAKKAKRLVRRAKRVLAVAERSAKRDTKGKKPKLTAACAASIGAAAEEVRSGLGG